MDQARLGSVERDCSDVVGRQNGSVCWWRHPSRTSPNQCLGPVRASRVGGRVECGLDQPGTQRALKPTSGDTPRSSMLRLSARPTTLLHTRSTRPNRPRGYRQAPELILGRTAVTVRPSAFSVVAADSTASNCMSDRTTEISRGARKVASPKPIPLAAPVITAT